MITLLAVTKFAGWTGELAFNGIIGQIWALPFLISIYVLNITTENKWVVFGLISLLLAYPTNHSVQVGKLPLLQWRTRQEYLTSSYQVGLPAMRTRCVLEPCQRQCTICVSRPAV
jgi:hypothetical protein